MKNLLFVVQILRLRLRMTKDEGLFGYALSEIQARRVLKMKKNLEQIAKEDDRFSPPGIRFVYEALGFTVKKITVEPRHVSGQTLCEGLRKLAVKKWGRMAMVVLNAWGIKTTRDFGEIVYLMIKHEWMSATGTDSISDFNDVYDFKTVFKDQFEF